MCPPWRWTKASPTWFRRPWWIGSGWAPSSGSPWPHAACEATWSAWSRSPNPVPLKTSRMSGLSRPTFRCSPPPCLPTLIWAAEYYVAPLARVLAKTAPPEPAQATSAVRIAGYSTDRWTSIRCSCRRGQGRTFPVGPGGGGRPLDRPDPGCRQRPSPRREVGAGRGAHGGGGCPPRCRPQVRPGCSGGGGGGSERRGGDCRLVEGCHHRGSGGGGNHAGALVAGPEPVDGDTGRGGPARHEGTPDPDGRGRSIGQDEGRPRATPTGRGREGSDCRVRA